MPHGYVIPVRTLRPVKADGCVASFCIYKRGPLRCSSITPGNAKAFKSGRVTCTDSRAFPFLLGLTKRGSVVENDQSTHKKMKIDVLRKGWALLAILFAAMALPLSGCSDDKDEPVDPEDPELPYVGAWKMSWDDDNEVQILVFDEDGSMDYYETTTRLFEEGMYEYRSSGRFTYNESNNRLGVTLEGESEYITLVGTGSDAYLDIDGDRAYRLARKNVPTKKFDGNYDDDDDDDDDDEGDALSNTSWKVTNMTGWGADELSDYKNLKLSFRSNGKVTETFSDDSSYKGEGTYTISGNTLKLNGQLVLINSWGSTYTYTLSGNKLTLKSSLNTSIIFTKQ